MAAKDYQIVLAAAAKRLSDVYANPAVGGPDDIPYRQLFLSAEAAVAYIGNASDVTSTNYGARAEVGAAGSQPLMIGAFDTGPIKLSDLWAAGAGSTLHILGIPF
jgi:hypothetical protein